MLTNLDDNRFEVLTNIFNTHSMESCIAKDLEIGIIIPLHRKDNNCNNYSGVTLVSAVYKIHERLLKKIQIYHRATTVRVKGMLLEGKMRLKPRLFNITNDGKM